MLDCFIFLLLLLNLFFPLLSCYLFMLSEKKYYGNIFPSLLNFLCWCFYLLSFYFNMLFFYIQFFIVYFYMSVVFFCSMNLYNVTSFFVYVFMPYLIINYALDDCVSKMDPMLSFMVFVLTSCAIMLFLCFMFCIVCFLYSGSCYIISSLYSYLCEGISFLYDKVSHNNFLSVKFILSPMKNMYSHIKAKEYGLSFVCYLLNCLTSFSVFLYKDFLGYFVKIIVSAIMDYIVLIFSSTYVFLVSIMTPFYNLLVFLCSQFLKSLSSISNSSFYISTFGHLEGYIYSFWLYNLKDSFYYLLSCFSPFYKVEESEVSLFSAIANVISMCMVLMCLFYSSSIYMVTMGSHMDVCFKFIASKNMCFMPFMILSSFVMVYFVSIMFFVSCLVTSLVVLASMFNFLVILYNKICSYLLVVKGCFSYFSDYLVMGVKGVDVNHFSNCWDKMEDVFKYEELFVHKVSEIQEDKLDVEEEKKDPNKFYYKSLFVNVVAVLSFTFVFVVMFISYVYF